jgi:microsomal dipeptidase-like Zn-dependent dipeptidase
MMKYICAFFMITLVVSAAKSQEIRAFMDLQIHPTMHVPYSFFGKGLKYFEKNKEPKLSYKHQFTNVNYANYLVHNKGARIIVTGALTKENVKTAAKAKRVILEQINYINAFAKEHHEDFEVAYSPQDVRRLVTTTDKTIIIHSIEGGKRLINSQEDADFWAAQGIAFITLIHLVDSDMGTAAILPGLATNLINIRGALKRKNKRGGLTEKGKNAILWMAKAGIMTDITHMSDKSRADALDFMEANNIPPISTHDGYRPIQNHPRGISESQIIRIYKNNGFVSLPISGMSLKPHNPEPKYKLILDTLKCFCNGSIDSYKFTYLEVKKVIESNYQLISENKNDVADFKNLSEPEKVKFSIGFQTDFNGWLNHSRPRYGKKGCWDLETGKQYEKIETDGMPHPGYLSSQWALLEKENVDIEPIRRNSEHFLQLWELFLNKKIVSRTP